MNIMKFFMASGLLLTTNLVFATVDCTTDTCINPVGTIDQAGIDIGNHGYNYSSSLPQSSPTNPGIFVKITATGIGSGVNCNAGDDFVYGTVPYDSTARQGIYATLLQAGASGKSVQLVVKDNTSSYCEIAAVLIEP